MEPVTPVLLQTPHSSGPAGKKGIIIFMGEMSLKIHEDLGLLLNNGTQNRHKCFYAGNNDEPAIAVRIA